VRPGKERHAVGEIPAWSSSHSASRRLQPKGATWWLSATPTCGWQGRSLPLELGTQSLGLWSPSLGRR
jgi:hypothetical protein